MLLRRIKGDDDDDDDDDDDYDDDGDDDDLTPSPAMAMMMMMTIISNGCTPLMLAVRRGGVDSVRQLVASMFLMETQVIINMMMTMIIKMQFMLIFKGSVPEYGLVLSVWYLFQKKLVQYGSNDYQIVELDQWKSTIH